MRKNPTPAERQFWEKVRGRQFLKKKFYRQYIIQHSDILGKKSFFIADFFCNEASLIVEIDGKIHEKQLDYDRIREEILLEMGYITIRFTNDEVFNEWEKVEVKLGEMVAARPPLS